MTIEQQKAWDHLKPIEQQSLFLQLSSGKSSWEAGSILKVSHYKYIEIRERAEKFFRMFTDFYNIHPSIFRPGCPCESCFIDYIEGTIEKRLTRVEASRYTGDSTHVLQNRRAKVITRNIVRLKESKDPWDIDTLKLILEFDRWNNFRILPGLLQQPSAYKRRDNKKIKIYIKYLLNKVPAWIHEKIIEKFKYRGKHKLWVCLVSEELYPEDGYYLLPVKDSEDIVNEMNRFYIYVFKDKEDADTFGFMVSKFMVKTKEVKMGQKFWPEYREVVSKALNYNQVNNIGFGIKSLDNAYGIKPKKVHKNRNKPNGLKRVDAEFFNKV
jgi:hypothetical protein